MASTEIQVFLQEIRTELIDRILPFQIEHMVDASGTGFYGSMRPDHTIDKSAPRGLVQCARLLWVYARAYSLFGDIEYLTTAEIAYDNLIERFQDRAKGGFFWTISAEGVPLERTKMIYGQAFAIYGLSEFYQATSRTEALSLAIKTFYLLEQKSVDPVYGGYWEACTEEWAPTLELAVDDVDQPVAKSMNTHLHLLEAYSNLLTVWPDPGLRQRLHRLIDIHHHRIYNPENRHLWLHFDERWRPLSPHFSYGHDIEASWLLWEAAEIIQDPTLINTIKPAVLALAEATLEEGFDQDSGLFEEGGPDGVLSREKHWWPQAEALVGLVNAYQLTRDPKYLAQVIRIWHFIQSSIVDPTHGEWLWGVDEHLDPLHREKAGMWKTPYHNGRACFELLHRLGQADQVSKFE